MSSSSPQFFLASESPRRKLLLQNAGFQFSVFPIKVSEQLKKNLNLEAQIKDLAERKNAAAVAGLKSLKTKDFLVLTADTMVVIDDEALGKPEDERQAEEFLTRLSGRSHEVKTAVCIFGSSNGKKICEIQSTQVYFRPILRQEILDYISSQEPMDKAGAYAIQGGAAKFVEKFVGPYDNVVGLPVELVKSILKKDFAYVTPH